uniref:Uncharacterized protein n=1 Tax=Anopheles dirus TaxID=7168 RepID=A0A182NCQ4_9DIPT
MEHAVKKDQFPLNELTIKLLKKLYLWNETPGQALSRVGCMLVALYPIVWLIPSWLFMVSSPDSLTQLLKAANEQIVFFTIFFKLCFFVINFRRWEGLFYALQRAFTSVMHDPDIEIQAILGHVDKSSHLLTKYYSSVLVFNCALYGTFPMLFVLVRYVLTGSYNVPLSTPIEANYFIPGYRTNFWIWLPLDVILNVLLELHGVMLFLVECFTWNMVHSTACMFRVLQVQANQLADHTREDQWGARMETFVTLHDAALRSAWELEEILSGQMLFIYMSTIFALCLGMTVLSIGFTDLYLMVSTGCVFGYCLFQTFSFSYLGTELIEESGAVADAIFHSKWHMQHVRKQKDLGFILMRAHKPVRLTTAKLFVVTRVSFTQVIKQAYTIFTLMSQFLDDTL